MCGGRSSRPAAAVGRCPDGRRRSTISPPRSSAGGPGGAVQDSEQSTPRPDSTRAAEVSPPRSSAGGPGGAVQDSEQSTPRPDSTRAAEVRPESENAPAAAAYEATRRQKRRAAERRKRRSGGAADASSAEDGPAAGSGWIVAATGEELTAAEMRALAEAGPDACVLFGKLDPCAAELGYARRHPDAARCVIVLAFPEKLGNEPSGSASATARDTLREWATSRGSPALAEWCREQGLRTLRELAALPRSDAAAAAPPAPDWGEEFEREHNHLASLLLG